MTQAASARGGASIARRIGRALASSSVVTGVGLVTAATAAGVIAEYVVRRRLAVRLGPEAYGAVYVGVAAATILARVSQLGVMAGVKRAAAIHVADGHPERAAAGVRAAMGIALGVGLLLAIVTACGARVLAPALLGSAASATAVVVAAGIVPCLAVAEVMQSALYGLRRSAAAIVVSPFAEKGVTLALLLPVLAFASTAEGALAVLLAGFAASAVCGAIFLHRGEAAMWRRGASSWQEGRALVAFGWRIQLSTLAMLLLGRLDGTLLGLFVGEREVGLYHAALPLAEIVQVGLVAAAAVIMPALAEPFARGDLATVRARYVRAQWWVLASSAPVAAAFLAVPSQAASLVYSRAFAPAGSALVPLALSVVLVVAAGPYVAALIAIGRTRTLLVATLGGLAAMVLADLALVPGLGIFGAGLGRVVAALAAGGIAAVGLRRALGGACLHPASARVVLSVALSALSGMGLAHAAAPSSSFASVAVVGSSASIACVFCMFLLRAIPREEVRWLRDRVARLMSEGEGRWSRAESCSS